MATVEARANGDIDSRSLRERFTIQQGGGPELPLYNSQRASTEGPSNAQYEQYTCFQDWKLLIRQKFQYIWHITISSLTILLDYMLMAHLPACNRPLVNPILAHLDTPNDAPQDPQLAEMLQQHKMAREMMMVLSGLLFAAAIQCFQVPGFGDNAFIEALGLCCVICSLTSLILSAAFELRLALLTPQNIRSWARDAQKLSTSQWWNLTVLLAMPAVWSTWATTFFVSSLAVFIWHNDSTISPNTKNDTNIASTGVTVLLFMAFSHSAVVLFIFFRLGNGQNRE